MLPIVALISSHCSFSSLESNHFCVLAVSSDTVFVMFLQNVNISNMRDKDNDCNSSCHGSYLRILHCWVPIDGT